MAIKRLISAGLAACFISAAAACSDGGKDIPAAVPASTGASGETAVDTTAQETEAQYSDFSGIDYKGYEFSILSYEDAGNWQIYLYAELENGELLNDAAYRRNTEVEEDLNCKISQIADGDYETKFRNAVMAGDGESFDLVCFWAPGQRSNYISENLTYDWGKVPNLRMDQPWFSADASETFKVRGKQYFASSDITYPIQQFMYLLCNTGLAESYGLESPYDIVERGAWTIDGVRAYTKSIYSDVNGDGTFDIGDIYGYIGHTNHFGRFIFCSGEPEVITRDDGFEVNLYSPKIISLVDKIRGLQSENSTLIYGDGYTPFSAGTAMIISYSSDPAKLRDVEFDFAFLPIPKYDEAQENYTAESTGGLIALPLSAADINRSGMIVEALAEASNKYMAEAFIETYVENKVLRDEKSVQIYRMMRRNQKYGISYNIDPSGLLAAHIFYSKLWDDPTIELTSYYESNISAIQQAYDDLYAAAGENS